MSEQKSQINFVTNQPQIELSSIPGDRIAELEKNTKNTVDSFENCFARNGDAEFYSRTLSDFYKKLLIKIYPDAKYRMYCPLVQGDSWATERVFEMYELVGGAEMKNQKAGDIDLVDTKVNEMRRKVHHNN